MNFYIFYYFYICGVISTAIAFYAAQEKGFKGFPLGQAIFVTICSFLYFITVPAVILIVLLKKLK